MELYCAIAVVMWLAYGFFLTTVYTFKGRPPLEPRGAVGFAVSIVLWALVIAMYYGAGTFDALLGN